MAGQSRTQISWRQVISQWYPDAESKAYFLPPVIITRMPFDSTMYAGQQIFVPKLPGLSSHLSSSCDMLDKCAPSGKPVHHPKEKGVFGMGTERRGSHPGIIVETQSTHKMWNNPKTIPSQPSRAQESDTRNDLALQKVLFCLRELAKQHNEVMFVLSQLNYSDYLRKPCYAAAVRHFKRPKELDHHLRRGDFDILIIHRKYGLLIGEIKSVNSNPQNFKITQVEIDAKIACRLRDAIKQLNLSEQVIRELLSDLQPDLCLRKTIILPNVSTAEMKHVLKHDSLLKRELAKCLAVEGQKRARDFCLFRDHLSSNQEQWTVDKLMIWWEKRVSKTIDPLMTSDLYMDLVARFCGPATSITVHCVTPPRVEVRTEGEGVSVVGERLALLVLTPEQVDLLTREPPKVKLSGPPGVGKSILLCLMGINWIYRGCDVHLVSVSLTSLAATRLIYYTIQMTIRANHADATGYLRPHEYDFWETEQDVDKALYEFMNDTFVNGLRIICDEFNDNGMHTSRLKRFVTALCTRYPDIRLWVASIWNDQKFTELQEEPMTHPLRCPPSVLEEIQRGVERHLNINTYTRTSLNTPCDGISVIRLQHAGARHSERGPTDCFECGKNIGIFLKHLGVGRKDVHNEKEKSNTKSVQINSSSSPPPLHFRDVFVLTRSTNVRDSNEDDHVTPHANDVVKGLRSEGIPVRVLTRMHVDDCAFSSVLEHTVHADDDQVTFTSYGNIVGLERKVVVCLHHRRHNDGNRSDEDLVALDQIHSMSRCTAQLVLVGYPGTIN